MELNIYVPQDFDILKVLPKVLHKYTDDALYIMDLIYWGKITSFKDDPWVQLRYHSLEQQVSERHLSSILERLKKKKIILCDNYCINGVKCHGYKLNELFYDKPFKLSTITRKKLVEKVQAWRSKETLAWTEVDHWLFTNLQKIQFIEEIDNIDISQINNIKKMILKVNGIKDAQWRYKLDDYGRRHTNISNFNKSLKKYLSVNFQSLVEIDIPNSQPIILSLLIRNQERDIRYINKYIPSPADIFEDGNKWVNLCELRQLYEFFCEKTGMDRDTQKKQLLVTLYDKNHKKLNKTAKVIKEEFPTVWKIINDYKEGNYQRLAHEMQRQESKLIYGVCDRIRHTHPDAFIATIHDSILTTPEMGHIILEALQDAFAELGLNPKLEIKNL